MDPWVKIFCVVSAIIAGAIATYSVADDIFWLFAQRHWRWDGRSAVRALQLVLGKLGPGKLGPGQLGPGQLGPGQLGPGAQLSGAQLSALKKWQIGPRGPVVRGPTVRP